MKNKILNIIKPIIENKTDLSKQGKVASYIPGLESSLIDDFGISFFIKDELFSLGEYNKKFTIQSISKPIVLLLALHLLGTEKVFEKVGMEPSGDPFNSFVKFELSRKKIPSNPMINIGAITVSSMIPGNTSEEKFNLYLDFLKKITGNSNLSINEKIYLGEKKTGNRNRSIAYLLASESAIIGNVEESLDFYFKQCSVEISTIDLAKIGYFLSTQGITIEGEKIIDCKLVQVTNAIITTCGMYEGSGEFLATVGIPSKSGVSGGILSFIPKQYCGIGIYGPSLNEKGNSVIGVEVLKKIAENFKINS